MNSLSYDYKQIEFKNLMKAQMRKYFDIVYKDKTSIVDVGRRLVDKDTLEIYKVHCVDVFFKTRYFVEKIVINRKKKVYNSWIDTFQYIEECVYTEHDGGVRYTQNYSVPFFVKSHKEKVFKKGCEVVEGIIKNCNFSNLKH
jgi:hypothetical protein